MAIGKLLFILSYLCVGIWGIFLLPFKNTVLLSKDLETSKIPAALAQSRPSKWVYRLIMLLGCVALTIIPWHFVLLSLALSFFAGRLCSPLYRHQMGFGVFLGLIMSSFIPWWMHNDVNRLKLDLVQSLIPISISGLFLYLYSKQVLVKVSSISWRVPLYMGFGLAVVFLTFTAGLSLHTQSINQWHHWGAYIGPAQLIAQGVIPFNEIPLQYGLGPTLLISVGCQWDCWNNLYWISGGFTIAMTLLLAYIALVLNSQKNFLREFFVLAIVLLTCIIWTALPMALESVTSMPSTSGMRFFPGVLMAALLMRVVNQQQPGLNISSAPFGWQYLPQNILWILSFYYSPEAGIQTSVLWFGYCLLMQIRNGDLPIRSILLVCLRMLPIFSAGLIIFSAGFLLAWGQSPNVMGYLTYILHPPGPLPVNQNGCIWFAVMVLILFFIWSKKSKLALQQPLEFSLWIIFLLCYANFTYFLGRSADNNILNLLPYFAVLLIGLESQLTQGMSKTIAGILLASIFAWLPIMGWGNYWRAIQAGDFFSLSPATLTQTYNRTNPISENYFRNQQEVADRKEIGSAVMLIRNQYHEPLEIVDRFNLLEASSSDSVWDGLHGPANFFYVPSILRQQYLENVQQRFKRPGWILINANMKEAKEYLDDYRAVYREDIKLNFGTYQAIRFVPTP